METAIRWAMDRRFLLMSALGAVIGMALVLDAARSSSATYDETAYLKIGCRWWRTGDQEQITRMGSPLTFWKLQQAPTLWILDRAGFGKRIDDPVNNEATLLPILRMGASWVWLVALVVTAVWAKRLHGPGAMALCAWLFALSPNLIAHGSLVTMEMPMIACAAAVGLLFTIFLQTQDRRAFIAAAAVAGLAFSCKFTAVLIPPICGLCWLARDFLRNCDLTRSHGIPTRSVGTSDILRTLRRITLGMIGFCLILVISNGIVTGFATIPLSERIGPHPSLAGRPGFLAALVEIPMPRDWVGFAAQIRHQRSGGPSYLFGKTRLTGWWYYYPVALAVKVPPVFWLLVVARMYLPQRRDSLLLLAIVAFLVVTIVGSSRNYGVRYLLPISPLALVWVSALAKGQKLIRGTAFLGLLGYAIACVSTHPRELSYFPAFVGGAHGGRELLADSNLDWGQGLRDLARLQRDRPELRDLTLFSFGETDPKLYDVIGINHIIDASDRHPTLPPSFQVSTRFVAVSASLQFGPWGPPGYFEPLRGIRPIAHTPDWTIAVYERPTQ